MNALELEMYINFGEFETRLYEVDVDAGDNEQDDGIWASVMKQADTNNPKGGNGQHQISVSVMGGVICTKSPTSWECWEFIFIPLGDMDDRGSSAQETMAS